MSSFLRDALSIVEDILPVQYSGQDHSFIIGGSPEAIMTTANGQTKLYAQCQSGRQKTVDMRSPTLRRELKRLAESGEGHSIVVNEVLYKFVSHSGGSRTTTPVSTLS